MWLPPGKQLRGQSEACCQATCSTPHVCCVCTHTYTQHPLPVGPRCPAACPVLLSTFPVRPCRKQEAPTQNRDQVGTQQLRARSPSLPGSCWPHKAPCTSPHWRCQPGPQALQVHQANRRLEGQDTRVRGATRFLKAASCGTSHLSPTLPPPRINTAGSSS